MAKARTRTPSGRHKGIATAAPGNHTPDTPTEWLRAVFDRALDGMAIADIQTRRFVRANPAYCRMLGYSIEELQQLGIHDTHPADHLAHVVEQFEKQAAGLISIAPDIPILRKDGSIFYADINASVVSFEGRPHLLGIFRDMTERRRAEESLRRSEGRYMRLHESMRDAFVSVDMQGRIQEFNAAYRDMLGYSAEELRKLTYADLTPPRWHDREARIVKEQILPFGYSDVYEKEYRRKDGTVIQVELRTFRVHNESGQPEAMWAIVRDITERKRSEASLKSSEERLQLLFTHMIEGVALHEVLFDEDGKPVNYRIVAVNPQYKKILDLRDENVIGKLGTEVYGTPEPPYLAEFTEVALTGRARRIQIYFAPMDKHFDISIAPWGTQGFATIFTDATARKEAEKALQASEDRYRTATELLSDYIFRMRVEADGRAVLESVSENFERITGRRLADIEQPGAWLKTIHPEDRPRIGHVLQRLIREEGEDHSEFRSSCATVWMSHAGSRSLRGPRPIPPRAG